MYHVSLYYLFQSMEDPETAVETQRALCERLGLQGRIYIASEGLNGTCAGPLDALREYQRETEAYFGTTIDWKDSESDRIPFARLQVKERPYLVNLGNDSLIDPDEEGGEYMSPEEWKKTLEERDDYVLLDVRNDYEAAVGRFEGAEIAPYSSFSKFSDWVDELDADASQPILMYCTGGIRCEKFSGLVKRKGYQEVYQLKGGILGYAKKFAGEHFEGKCFVFDDRMVVDIGGKPDHKARCIHCTTSTSRYLNCANMDCHKLMLCCDECALEHQGCCSQSCQSAPRLRTFTEEHLQRPFRRQSQEEVPSDTLGEASQ